MKPLPSLPSLLLGDYFYFARKVNKQLVRCHEALFYMFGGLLITDIALGYARYLRQFN